MKRSTMLVCVIAGVCMMFLGAVLLFTEADRAAYTGWETVAVQAPDPQSWDDGWETDTIGTYDVSQVSVIQVVTKGMDIRLYDGWDKTIEVDVPARDQTHVSCALDEGNGFLIVEEIGDGGDGEITLWLPKDCADSLTAATGSGEITVSSVRGDSMDYTLKSASGTVNLYDSRLKNLTLTTESGDINFSDAEIYDSLTAETASGFISVYGLEGEDCRFTSASGDMDLWDARCTALTAETASGDVDLESGDIPAVTIRTASGDVDLDLPGAPEDYTVRLSTDNGHVDGLESRDGGSRTLDVTTASGDVEATFNYDSLPGGYDGHEHDGHGYDD